LDGDSAPPNRGTHTQFSAHVRCGRVAGLITIPLHTQVGLGLRRHCVRWGSQLPPRKGHIPHFSAHVWWTDQNATWYGLRTAEDLSLYLMNFMFHTTLDAVGNILRLHYKSMKLVFHFHKVALGRYLGEVNMFFVCVKKGSFCLQQCKKR